MSKILLFQSVLLLITFFALSTSEAAVMAVDYGTDWFKVALVKPGIPLDIVLNRDSKRKTKSVLTVRGEERIYGADAVNLGARFPQNTYFTLKKVLGRLADDTYSMEYQSTFPNKIIPGPKRGTVEFQHNDTTVFSVEELLAMQLSHAKELAEVTAQEAIKDAVITVPPYYNQFERQAVLDAAELAGLHVLSLINEGTSVGLNYAISHFSSFTEEPQYHLFYDMGAGSTKASLISFKTVSVKDVGRFNKTAINLDVISIGYDRTLGGQEIDIRLRRHFAEKFDAKFSGKLKESIFKSPRAMAMLLKEANRIKQILSANTETVASIENLHEEHDLRLTITRTELDTMMVDLVKRVGGPIQEALSNAGMSLSDLKSCVLVGGGIRVPSIQTMIKEIVGEDRIAQNVNGDEAAVLGAAFRGAALSHQFKVKEIKIKDITPYPIEVSYVSEPKESEDGTIKSKLYNTVLFNEYSAVESRKLMSFKRTSDFNFTLRYGNLNENVDKNFGPKDIIVSKITGLADAIKRFEDTSSEKPKVKVTLQLSESGFVTSKDAVLTIEQQTFTDKVKTFFGVNGNKSDDSIKEVPFQEDTTSSVNASDPNELNNTQISEAESQKQTKKIETITLNLEIENVGIKPLGTEEKENSIRRLHAMDDADRQRRAREEARNSLESFVYRVQDLLSDKDLIKVTTEKQRSELSLKASETSDWLYGEGEESSTEEFQIRLHNLRSLEQPITYRYEELTRRPDAVRAIQSVIKKTREFIDQVLLNSTAEDQLTADADLDRLISVCRRVEQWLDEKLFEQERIPLHVDPVLTSSDIEKKVREIERELLFLATRRPPKNISSTGDSQSTSSTDESESASQTTALTGETASTNIPPKKHEEL